MQLLELPQQPRPTATHTEPTVVFVMSTSLAGSTLLGAILGSHSKAAFLGEPALILRQTKDGAWRHRKFCSVCELEHRAECPVWNGDIVEALRSNPDDVYKLASAKIGSRRVLVDASKNLEWMRAGAGRASNIKVIHLVRKVQAYVASMLTRKSAGIRVPEMLALNWARDNFAIENTVREMGIPYQLVRCRDLATDPQGTLDAVSAFVGLKSERNQLKFWEHDHHIVKSNPGLVSQFERRSQHPERYIPHVPAHKEHTHIYLDEKWKHILDVDLLSRLYAIPEVQRATDRYGLVKPELPRLRLRTEMRARATVMGADIVGAAMNTARSLLRR